MLPDRLLLTAEGDATGETGGGTPVAATTNGAPAAPAPAATPAPSWYSSAESLKTSHPEIWTSFENGVKAGQIKDLSSFVIKGISAEKKLGTALTLPNKEKAEEVQAFKSKLVTAGILPAVPESADKYEVKLDSIPEAMRSGPVVESVKNWAHKHGLSQEAVGELMAIEAQRYEETVKPALAYTAEQGEAAINDLAKEWGKEPAALKAAGGRWLAQHFSPEEIEAMEKQNFANSPVAIKYAIRAGMDTGEDISVIDGMGTLSDTEYEDFMKNLGDPKHPDFQLFMKGDPQDPKRIALMAKREALLKRAHPGEVK